MKIKRLSPRLTVLMLCMLSVITFTCPGYSDEIHALERGTLSDSLKGEELLNQRQKFNKLKRTTRNIYKVTMRSNVAFRLQTALGYVSTIDLPEPALKVFVGDQELFKVEVYERQVLVKPITDEEDARTNLVIVTATQRLAFDVSVGFPETADFVIDFRLPQEDESLVKNAFEDKVKNETAKIKEVYLEKTKELEEKANSLSEKKILEKVSSGVQTVELRRSEAEGEVQLNLLSLSQVADKAYLRFSILNYSKTPYKILQIVTGAINEEKRILKNREVGVISFPSNLELPETIAPDAYEYGVLVFDYRALGKSQKAFIRVQEDAELGQKRNIEIKGFKWFD